MIGFRSSEVVRPRVLVLHGLSSSGQEKAAFLRSLGYDVHVPRLPERDFPGAVRVAQDALDELNPRVVVGSSRGGAVALHMDVGDRPVVLLAPAYRLFGGWPRAASLPQGSVVIHSPDDPMIPYRHSVELAGRLPGLELITAGRTHHLNCAGGRAALEKAMRDLVPVSHAARSMKDDPEGMQ